MIPSDIPQQYKAQVDRLNLQIMEAVKKLTPIMEELGCDNYVLRGEKYVVTIGPEDSSCENCGEDLDANCDRWGITSS